MSAKKEVKASVLWDCDAPEVLSAGTTHVVQEAIMALELFTDEAALGYTLAEVARITCVPEAELEKYTPNADTPDSMPRSVAQAIIAGYDAVATRFATGNDPANMGNRYIIDLAYPPQLVAIIMSILHIHMVSRPPFITGDDDDPIDKLTADKNIAPLMEASGIRTLDDVVKMHLGLVVSLNRGVAQNMAKGIQDFITEANADVKKGLDK